MKAAVLHGKVLVAEGENLEERGDEIKFS